MLKKYQDIISSPAAMEREEASGNPTVGHLMFLIEAYKVSLQFDRLRWFLLFHIWHFLSRP
jgi:hypothetical protein